MADATSTRAQRRIAKKYLRNVWTIHRAAKTVGLPFEVACALIEKESGGRNVYGHDAGGALSGYPEEVSEENYRVFRWMVLTRGMTSNGVGPCQITSPGFFRQMEEQGLRPWVKYDNMLFGFRLLLSYYKSYKSWRAAGRLYNGADAYGVDLVNRINTWKKRFASA